MSEHYLKRELYDRFQQDDALVEFLQSGSLDGMWYWDLDNPEHEWMSPRFWEVFGYDPATREHLASEWQDMIHPEDLKVALENFHQHCADPSHPYDQIVRYRHRDGSMVWVRCRGIVLRDDAGKPIRMLGAHTNVTALKKNEQRIQRLASDLERRAEELQRVNDELKAFAYSVSHDLRAPLRAIGGYAELLAEDHAEVLDEDGQHLLSVIQRNVSEMNALIQALLSLSRLSQKPLSQTRIDMTACVRQCFERAAPGEGVVLSVEPLPEAVGDPELITRVWTNLISNAIKYSSKEATPRVTVRGRQEGGEVIFAVADNGVGFDMKYADRLFSPFQRLHSRKAFSGHGIGLALVRRVITRHGGRVWAEAAPGEGAVFSFTLPASATPP